MELKFSKLEFHGVKKNLPKWNSSLLNSSSKRVNFFKWNLSVPGQYAIFYFSQVTASLSLSLSLSHSIASSLVPRFSQCLLFSSLFLLQHHAMPYLLLNERWPPNSDDKRRRSIRKQGKLE